MRFFLASIPDLIFEARRLARRWLRPGARPVDLTPPLSFIAGAEAFRLADPAALIAARPEWRPLSARASALLRASCEDLCRAAQSLDQEALQTAPAGARGPLGSSMGAMEAMGCLLIHQERQRRALAVEREALCLLASRCARIFGEPPGSPFGSEGLDAPQALLNGRTLLSFFVASRHFELCALLLEIGADPEAPDAEGLAPLELAETKARSLEGGAGRAQAASLQARELASLLQRGALARGELSVGRSPKTSPRRL